MHPQHQRFLDILNNNLNYIATELSLDEDFLEILFNDGLINETRFMWLHVEEDEDPFLVRLKREYIIRTVMDENDKSPFAFVLFVGALVLTEQDDIIDSLNCPDISNLNFRFPSD